MSLLEADYSTKLSAKVIEKTNYQWEGAEPLYKLAGRNYYVDPYPAHAHNIKEVGKQLVKVQSLVNIPVTYYVLHHEVKERCNAFATTAITDWDEGLSERQVVLSAKRTPIPYSMTRYLVSHEYGHAIDYHIEEEFDYMIRPAYANMRQANPSDIGWLNTVKEIIADDFRIMVCAEQTDFWPHTDVAHPARTTVEAANFWQYIVRGKWQEAIDVLDKFAE